MAAALVSFVALRPVLPVDETRYLDVAWEMWLSGDLFHLTRNGDLYAHKPPLLFWIINLVWAGTGVSEFAARLVGPGFGIATAWATARLARRFWPHDKGIGGQAVLVLAGFTVFLIYASATMFDTMLCFATVLGIGVLWRIGQGARGAGPWLGFGAVLALGVYAKGPVILVHLLPALLTMRLWAPSPPRLGDAARGAGLALALTLALVSLWLVPAVVTGTEAYRHELLWTQTAGRVAGGFAHDRPVWFLAVLLPVLLFPWGWSIGLWNAVVQSVKAEGPGRLLALWAGIAFVAFSLISGKQAHYLLPEYPAMALLFARACRGGPDSAAPRFALVPVLPLLVGGVFLAIAFGVIPRERDLAALEPWWAVAMGGVLSVLLAAVAWRLRSSAGPLVAGIGLAVAAHLLIATTDLRRAYDATPIATEIQASEASGAAIYGMTYNAEFNFAARAQAPFATPQTATELSDWMMAHPGGLIIAPLEPAPFDAPPQLSVLYNGQHLGLWRSAPGLSVRG